MVLRLIGFIAVLLTAIAGMARSASAQDLPPWALVILMERLRVDEVARDSTGVVVVRGSRVESDGRIIPAQVIICGLYAPDRWYLAIQDHTLMTDDRTPVGQGVCDTVFAIARHSKDAQERRSMDVPP
jgi:hypothetical protein